jgi:hypothetical protein
MVDIHSVVASSHPSRRERESKWETNSRSRARRSRWAGGRTDGTTVMLERQPQRTTSTTASPSAVAGIDDALLAVRQLLNNSPPSEASPSAAEQRRHDIDQLIIAAINTPHQERRVPAICAAVARSASDAHTICGHKHPQCCQLRAHRRNIAHRWQAI